MRGFKLTTVADPETGTNIHDFELSGGDLIPVDGVQAAGQEIKTRLQLFKGEYFLDLREGVPYFQEILKKGVDPARVREIIRQVIESVPGIVDAPEITIDFDRAARTATVVWRARYLGGAVVRSEDFGPLIVEL